MVGKELFEIINYRDLLRNLVYRDITIKYKRSIIGFFWTMINPVANTLVLTIVFATNFNFPIKDYILYLFSGFLLWNFFAQSTLLSSRSMLGSSVIFKKVYVPKSIFVYSIICSELLNFAFASIMLFLLTLIFRQGLPLSIIFLPISIIFIVFFTLGIALILSASSVFFYDIIDSYQFLLLPWLYLTPVIYPLEIIPPKFLPLIKLNPMFYFVECFRIPIYLGQIPSWEIIGVALLCSSTSFLIGYNIFNRLSDDFIFYV